MPREKQTEMMLAKDILKIYPVPDPLEVYHKFVPSIQHSMSMVEFVGAAIRNGQIKFKKPKSESAAKPDAPAEEEPAAHGTKSIASQKKRGRGRKPTLSSVDTLDEVASLNSSTSSTRSRKAKGTGTEGTSDDSVCSTTSSRGRRAAAQAAEQKLVQVQNSNTKVKLRRPTDFDEKKSSKGTSSPPVKCRRTRRKNSAGGSQDEEVQPEEVQGQGEETNTDNQPLACLTKTCAVEVDRISTPQVAAIMKSSGETVSAKKKSEDLFNDVEEEKVVQGSNVNLNITHNVVSSGRTLRGKDSISSNEDDLHSHPVAHSSPITDTPSSEFRGFHPQSVKRSMVRAEPMIFRSNTFVKPGNAESNVEAIELETKNLVCHQITATVDKSKIDLVETETASVTRTQLLRKRKSQEMEETDSEDEVDEKESESPALRSRTKTIRKVAEDNVPEEENVRSRTKVIKKEKPADGVEETNVESDTKLPVDAVKKQAVADVKSPVSPKGELVKKRVEDFEKMTAEEQEGRGKRVTRNAAKKAPPSERLQRQKANEANKLTNSTNHRTPVAENVAHVHKQVASEVDKKKLEDKLKRQAKEEDAKAKKEKTLRATSEETRRKREEKLQKVTAAKDAAEKKKAMLAAKAEKEKEEKLKQIAADKEKQKEEYLMKKKLMMQQKAMEHEERRKQEEAARLARLKEQEEEHKRVLAMKEREQEKLKKAAELRLAEAEKAKQQNTKLGKQAAINSAKANLQNDDETNPKDETFRVPPVESYEMTPAREDRSPLEPKTEDDYGIDDAVSGDSSDDESQPRKQIPLWAQQKNRKRLLLVNSHVPQELWNQFMTCNANPDVNQLFEGNPVRPRVRTSSAVWATPPRL